MPEFYREALDAAGCMEPTEVNWNPDGNLDTWQEVAEALNSLSPRQQCHAIYADWLLQLHEPGGGAQIQIRDLLLGEGALAANYLAELAQNADDAGADTLHVALDGEWLWVANNGRQLSSLNLLGLCRFFVHSNGRVVGLTPETIGRFGIGFKACHRVAEEVLVWSWGEAPEFGFRLPICHGGGAAARPNPKILRRLLDRLQSAGRPITNRRPNVQLGHCTPEALDGVPACFPASLREKIRRFQFDNENQGVWFALHLHENGRQEAEQRISAQAESLYELCPLFLRNLRNVTLQDRTMRMVVGTTFGNDVGTLVGRRITLAVTDGDGNTKNDRLVMLTGDGRVQWKLALPADSEFRLKSPSAGQFSLRSGGGYAYFPLPALNWPWRAHLHLACRTNLARSDWNADDQTAIHENLISAAQGLAAWTTANPDQWHSSWQPLDILAESDAGVQDQSSASVFAAAYTKSISDKLAVRTLWGTLTTPALACGLLLERGQASRDAWLSIAQFIPEEVREKFPLVVLTDEVGHFALNRLESERAKEIFETLRTDIHDASFWRSFTVAALASIPEPSGGYSRSEFIQDMLESVPLNRHDGGTITFEQASQSRFAVQLASEWHEHFRHLSENWLDRNSVLAGLTIFEVRVSQMLRSLATPSAVPTDWEKVSRMAELDFRELGDRFWNIQRPVCPSNLADAVVRAIWVESGKDWVRLTDVWIGDEPIAMMRGVVASFARRHEEFNNARRNGIKSNLQRWDLAVKYESLILERINEVCLGEFQRRLDKDRPENPDRLKMLVLRDDWRPERLPFAWREVVAEAATKAIIKLLQRDVSPLPRGKTIVVGDGDVEVILSWLSAYLQAPKWLKPEGVRWMEERGVFRQLGIDCVVLVDLNQEKKAALGKELLAGFRHWDLGQIGEHHLRAMGKLFRDATSTWTVGYSGGADKRLNEHCVWIQPIASDDAETPQVCILAAANGHELSGGRFLPEVLAKVPEIRGKCFQISDLTPESFSADEDDATHLTEAEIPEALNQNMWFLRLRQLCPQMSIVSLPGHQRVKWKRGDMELVIPKATFGLCKLGDADAIFISDSNRRVTPDSGHRFLPVLVAYTQVAPEDRVIASAVRRNRGLRKVYLENRAKIKARLVQAHATDMGYEAQHVIRELLQNAESAYASRREDPPPIALTFEVTAAPENQGASWNVEVAHFGRAFNEQDKDGNDRSDDIERLCALSALQNRTNEEIGRFNRGFKSIFQVTDEVHVTSGGYNFKVEDLLLLDPAEPSRSGEGLDQGTRFSFKVSAEKKSALFRETGGMENSFKSVELVFLRYVSQIQVKVSGQCDRRFELHRDQHLGDWQTLRIIEIAGSQNEESIFLVCHKRDGGGPRFAVAIRIDDDGLPAPMPEDARFLYRTFPLQQKSSWFPFLINSDDFLTDHGRTGLSPKPENEALIICGLKMSLSLLRQKIEGCEGNIESWLSWVRVLERRRLMDGAATLQSQRRVYEETVNEFDAWLLKHLPDGTQLRPSAEFVFPSRLLRRLHGLPEWSAAFGIESASWIAQEVSEASSDFGGGQQSIYSLPMQVALLVAQGADKEALRTSLEEISSLEFAQDIVSSQEIESALGLVARHQVAQFRELLVLLPEDILSPDEEGEIGEGIEASDLEVGWNELEALKEFSLAGWMGRLVFDCQELGTLDQQRLIFGSPGTQESKECWHRLLCLGSLLGARALPQTVRRFWEQQLTSRAIFSATGENELAMLLDEISHRTFADLDATGENAEMWRRVFYDFQKLRLFVFEDDLPGAFLKHLRSSEEWDAPINFLKSGFRKNERRWAGSVGQSMTAPLFWIVRELRRIELIDNPVFDPSCYYLNGPARRVLCRLPGFDESDLRVYRFEQLLDLSRRCHELLGEVLPGQFDLPLQWYASQNPR